ncbi:MAG: hypothetical protein H6767_01720 [Candidatus Peribacteria bacterium]|nr:MAG: hypothetical protein H6767_01720 [Candidatus Peribacteria bacterium]
MKNLSGFGIQGKVLSESAAAGLLEYLKMHQKEDMSFLQELSVLSFSDRMELDEATIRNLDLVYNFQTKSSTLGTLF